MAEAAVSICGGFGAQREGSERTAAACVIALNIFGVLDEGSRKKSTESRSDE